MKKERVLKLVLARGSATLLRQAISSWRNYSLKIDGLMRFQILSRIFASN